MGDLLNDMAMGAGLGAIAGKVVVSRAERRRGELPPHEVRQVEVAWIMAGSVVLGALGQAARVLYA
jgi:hypothetical protein